MDDEEDSCCWSLRESDENNRGETEDDKTFPFCCEFRARDASKAQGASGSSLLNG